VYRGGGDLTPKYNLAEVKIKNGKVQPIRGVSLELDAMDAAKHGIPHQVKSIPDELIRNRAARQKTGAPRNQA